MDPALQAWLTPGGLAAVIAAVLWLVRTSITQDRRLTGAEGLEARLFGDGKGNPGVLASYVTREKCGDNHRDLLSDAFDAIRALERAWVDDRQKQAVALERIDGLLQRLEEKLDALADSPRPLNRTKTNPGFKQG